MKRVIIQIVVLALFPFVGQAQHELSVYGGGGLSGLNYKTSVGDQKTGFGGQSGLGYRFFFTYHLGVGTGIEYATYGAKFNADKFNAGHSTTDTEGVEFDFRSVVSGYSEKQRVACLQIPVTLQYQTVGEHKYYVAGGFKVGLPLNARYNSTASSLQNTGYYAEEVYEYATQQFMGFGAFNDRESQGDLSFNTVFFLSLETGVKFKLNPELSLYVGAYLDYALYNTLEKPSSSLVMYNSSKPTDFALNSVIRSQHTQNGGAASFTEKITPIAAGVKVILALGIK